MLITREDVHKADMARSSKKASANDPAAASGLAHLRPRKAANYPPSETIRLDRLNTAVFDNLLGEACHPDAIQNKKKIREEKKEEASLKLKSICAMNQQVIAGNDSSKDGALMHGNDSPGDGEDLLDKTVPLDGENLTENEDNPNETPEVMSNSNQTTSTIQLTLDGKHPPKNDKSTVDAGVQTNPVRLGCGCSRCKVIFDGVTELLNLTQNSDCQFHTSKDKPRGIQALSGSLSDTIERKDTPLYSGSTIMLSATDKSMLKDLNSEDDPKECINIIMDSLYEPAEMAQMTACGRTKGSIPMAKPHFKQILAYLKHKYRDCKGTQKEITKSAVVALINAKCYSTRRQIWDRIKKNPEDPDLASAVRDPLQKKTRDPNKPNESQPVKKKKKSKKSKDLEKSERKKETERNYHGSSLSKSSNDKHSRERRKEREERPREKSRRDRESRDREDGGHSHKKLKLKDSSSSSKHSDAKSKSTFFKSDASKHFRHVSPRKKSSSSVRNNKVPNQPNFCNNLLTPTKKPEEDSSVFKTSTPKFGFKQPKPLEELLGNRISDSEDDDEMQAQADGGSHLNQDQDQDDSSDQHSSGESETEGSIDTD